MKEREKELDRLEIGQGQTLEDNEDIINRKIQKNGFIFQVEKDPQALQHKIARENQMMSPMLQKDL